MKIITRGVIDWETLKVIEEDSFEYEGPLALAVYATTNPPIKIAGGPLVSFGRTESGNAGGALWVYNSPDVIATVEGANYFSNALALGMQPGDLVYIVDSTTPHAYLETMGAVVAAGGSLSGVHVTTQ